MNQIEPSLAGFVFGNEGLWLTETFGKLFLRQPGLGPDVSQESSEFLVLVAMNALFHAGQLFNWKLDPYTKMVYSVHSIRSDSNNESGNLGLGDAKGAWVALIGHPMCRDEFLEIRKFSDGCNRRHF